MEEECEEELEEEAEETQEETSSDVRAGEVGSSYLRIILLCSTMI